MRVLHVSGSPRHRPVAAAVLSGLLAAAGLWPATGATQDVASAMAALEARDYAGAARAFADAADASDDPAVAERATQYTFATGFDGYALRAASRWVELAPDNPLAREVLGRLNLRRHQVDAAARELSLALGAAEPRRDEVYLALAADLAAEDDAALVTRVLARLAGEDPLAPGLQLALGNAALRSREWELAAAAAAAASLDDPDWEEPQLLAARAQAGAGDIEPALARIAALEVDEERAGLALERVRILEDAGRLDEARAVVEELAARFGERPPVIRARAFLDMRADRLDAAARGFDTLAGADQDRAEAFYYLGQIARDQGDAERGRRTLGRITTGPYLVPARLAIAESLAREGKLDEALESLRRFAADYPPRAFDVLDAEAQLLASADRLDEALAVHDRALAYKPESPAVLLARGALLDRLGRVDEALRDLARAAAIAPGDPVVENAYGYTLAYRTRRTGEAHARIRRAIEQSPDSAAIQDSMGYVLYRQGRVAEARSWLEQAFAGLPDPEVAAHLAEVWQAAGEQERARDLALAVLLAACVRPSPPAPPPVADPARLAALERWEARGRIAVRQDGPGASGSQAGLEWRQQGALTAVSLRGPFGTGGYEIESGPDGVTLRTAAGDTVERVADARAAEAWLAGAAGFAFPVASARWWLLGLPDPDRPAEARRDAGGRLLQLRQDGWDVDYAEYRASGGFWLPRRLTLATTQPATGAAVRVRVVVDRWLLDTAARPIRQ